MYHKAKANGRRIQYRKLASSKAHERDYWEGSGKKEQEAME
jgi:hypothetical protein